MFLWLKLVAVEDSFALIRDKAAAANVRAARPMVARCLAIVIVACVTGRGTRGHPR